MFSRVTRVTALVMSWLMLVTTIAPAQIIRPSRQPVYRNNFAATPSVAAPDSTTGLVPGVLARGFDGPVNPDEYVIGPGDQFVLVVKSSGAQFDLVVLPEGNVLVPNAGMIRAAGLTITEFRQALKRVAATFYRGGEFYCELVVPRTFVVYVLGQVKRPGPVFVAAPFRLDMVVAAAGGVLERGAQREIEVRDQDGTARTYDLLRLTRLGELKQNPMLHEGQNVFVPTRGASAEIRGEIWREQLYEIVPGETVQDLIDLAGGFTTNAEQDHMVLERIEGDDRVSIVPTNAEQAPTIVLQDRDVVVVPDRRSFPGIDFVRVQGGGGRDGRIYLQPGETLASFMPRFIRLRNDFDLANCSIERRADDGKVTFIPIDLKKIVEGDTTGTIALQPGDVINIPALQDRVFVAGEVVNPGGQDYLRGAPAGRYIAIAGGPTDVGSIDKLEIYDDYGNSRDANRNSVVYRGENVLVKRRTGVILGNLFLGFVSLTSLFLSIYAVSKN